MAVCRWCGLPDTKAAVVWARKSRDTGGEGNQELRSNLLQRGQEHLLQGGQKNSLKRFLEGVAPVFHLLLSNSHFRLLVEIRGHWQIDQKKLGHRFGVGS